MENSPSSISNAETPHTTTQSRGQSRTHSRTPSQLQSQVQAQFQSLGTVINQSPMSVSESVSVAGSPINNNNSNNNDNDNDNGLLSPMNGIRAPQTGPNTNGIPTNNTNTNTTGNNNADVEMKDIEESKTREENAHQTDNENEETNIKNRIEKLKELVSSMENTRLELIPLLLDVVEQVKNGSLSIKDADNACGPIRVRINRLTDWRKSVEDGIKELEKLQDPNINSINNLDIKTRIELKNRGIENFVNKIQQHYSGESLPPAKTP